MAEAVAAHRRPGHARGLRRAHPRPGPRGRRDRRRLHLGRRPDPLGQGRLRLGMDLPPRASSMHGAGHGLLAADIGNSHTVLGLLDDGEVSARLAGLHRRAAHRRRVGGAAARAARRRRSTTVDGIAVARPCRRCCTSGARCWRGTSPTSPAVVVEPGVRTGDPGADGQPARGRLRPDRQRAGRGHPVRRAGDRGRLRHRDHLRRGQRAGPVRRRRDRARHRDLARGAGPARRPAAQGRAGPAADGDRQEHRRGAAVRDGLRRRRPGRGHRGPDDRRARRRTGRRHA